MHTSPPQPCQPEQPPAPAPEGLAAPASTPSQPLREQSIEQTLGELKAGRRLEDVLASIESFLLSQVAKTEKAIQQCQAAASQNLALQRMLADFEQQKEVWDEQRQAEENRLLAAGERLIQGWRQLEAARQDGPAS